MQYMQRTTIMLPPGLKNRAARRAHELGISLGELIRQSLDAQLNRRPEPLHEDPMFADDEVFQGEAPDDSSKNHDRYLYGEES
jgi:hypothetical protein